MHGRGGENWGRVRRRLMLAAGDRVVADFFYKDDRKISVGECALFKPPQDSPPFIGIIRWLTSKDQNTQLSVNWLYRPADVKLPKGIVLDAAPNEIFYSFHTDKIPAASLLHPCKVAFLPKGGELPPGTSSLICRRVYDIAKKCLWWLTDPDYIDERQEEVNQLLVKTQKEMHATLRSGSPKPASGPTSTSQIKTTSDNTQSCAPSFPSHNKRKKREHGEHGTESIKRERSSKPDEGDSNQFKANDILKSEIEHITENGGLVDSEGVDKLVKLMQPDRAERKMDLYCKSMIVGAIAGTDKFDCLTRFLQLRGLPVLDEWLQDIHKGKIDAVKDGEKAVEEFLLILLRALDKLPVNLQALQMCNIGRSVNHLRTNKNLEIQKKARSLVDTWKKRVEAEMNIIETRSGSSGPVSWPSKSRCPEVSQGGSRHGGGFSEMKSSIAPASKSPSPKSLLGANTKSPSSSPGSIKTTLSSGAGKDVFTRVSIASDLPSTPAREEKSSGSSQSHTYSQSLSGKEDARSSTAGSMSVNKISSGTSRNRKSINGCPGPAASGVQREAGSSKTTSLHSASTSEKVSGLTCEKTVDVPVVEGKNQKLIVKIPNPGRSPAPSPSTGLSEDPNIMNSRASSPLPSKKHDHFDRNGKEKNHMRRVNVITESWQSNNFKDVLNGSDECGVSPTATPNEEQVNKNPAEVSKAASSSPPEKNFSDPIPLTAVRASPSARDDVGMNLLASVAADDMPNANLVSPTPGHLENEKQGGVGESNVKSSSMDNHQSESGGGAENDKNIGGTNGSFKDMAAMEHHKHSNTFHVDAQVTADQSLETDETTKMRESASVAVSPVCKENLMNGDVSRHQEQKAIIKSHEGIQEGKENGPLLVKEKGNMVLASGIEGEKPTVEVHSSESFRKEAQKSTVVSEEFSGDVPSETKPFSASVKSENIEEADKIVSRPCGFTKDLVSENPDGFKTENVDKLDDRSSTGKARGEGSFQDSKHPSVIEGSTGTAHKSEQLEVETGREAGGAIEEGTDKPAFMKTDASLSNEGTQNVDAKLSFDLNEGFTAEEGILEKSSNLSVTQHTSSVINLPFPAAAKGPFVPIQDLLRSKGELGWKGSAATSAFRPAEPRKVFEMPLHSSSVSLPGASGNNNRRSILDFDLNVADEEMASHDLAIEASSVSGLKSNPDLHGPNSGRFELDLNSIIEANEIDPSTSGNSRFESPYPQDKSAFSSGYSKGESQSGFDLNNGPMVDGETSEQFYHQQPQVSVGSLRMKNAQVGNFSSWYPSSNPYPPTAVPSVFHDMGKKSFPVISPQKLPGPSAGTFIPDMYRGPVLSSSPAVPYPSPYQYPVFPFGTSLSTPYMDSSSDGRFSLPNVDYNMRGPAAAAPHRSYMVSRPDGSGNSETESNRKSGRTGLDLNAGPGGGGDTEGRDDTMLLASRQFSVASSQPLVEEQTRMYHLSGGTLKRKEPEGSWGTESSRHKQSPWK